MSGPRTTNFGDASWRENATAVLAHYAIQVREFARIPQGLINLTLRVEAGDGERFVLQRLHAVFGDGVNANLVQVTEHLRRAGLLTPELVRTRAGKLSVPMPDGLWRMLSFVDGQALDALANPQQARSAGGLLGRFHAALCDFDAVLASERPPVHELERHLRHLTAVRARHPAHRHAARVDDLAARLATLLPQVSPFCCAPLRLMHGDPKISNLLFDTTATQAQCLIDLDTLAYMPLAYELGDAFRSWCNPASEDAADARFDLSLFEAAVEGYSAAARQFVTRAEIAAIVPATLAIYLELAARFLADALDERYFAWDSSRYPGRAEHNLARAAGQLAAAASLIARRTQAEAIIAACLDTLSP